MSELLPCPFCGGTKPEPEMNAQNWPMVQCIDCGACGPCIEIDAAKAAAGWNNRPHEEWKREAIAKAIYEAEPYEEPGEYVDSFLVAPGGPLSWEQAKARDAEFAPEYMLPITKPAYDAADAVLRTLARSCPEWQPISIAPKDMPVNIFVPTNRPERRILSAYRNEVGWTILSGSIVIGEPTHWQPLPSPPTT